MKDLIIVPTDQCLGVKLCTDGKLHFEGISIPENMAAFMNPVFVWLNEFKHTKPGNVTASFRIQYMNTISSRYFCDLILLINSFKEIGCLVSFNWEYEEEDADLCEMGEEFELITQVSFNYSTY